MNAYLTPESYLPHRRPMVVLDEVKNVTDDSVDTRSFVKKDKALGFFLEDDDTLSTSIIIELFAQSVGVWSGYFAKANGADICPMGMLLGGRDIKANVKHFTLGTELNISMKMLMQDGDLATFEGIIKNGFDNEVLASGRINVIALNDEQIKVLFRR